MMRKIALILFCIKTTFCGLVITEVAPNPVGSSTSIPGDATHEFIEFFNSGPETLDLSSYYIKTGSSTSASAPDSNNIEVWKGDSLLLPGRYAVLFGRKYLSAPESTWYRLQDSAAVFLTRKTYIRSGTMANASTWIEAYDSKGRLATTFNRARSSAMDPGEGRSWHLCSSDSSDSPANWRIAFPDPGGPFALTAGRQYGRTLIINEIMNDPATGNPEWIEFLNNGSDTVNLAGWSLGGNENTGALLCAVPLYVPANGYVVAAESGSVGKGSFRDLLCPLVIPDDWDALKRDDDIAFIRDPQGKTADSVHYCEGWFPVNKGVSVERTGVAWRKSFSPTGSTPGFANSVEPSGGSVLVFKIAERTFCPGKGGLRMRLEAPAQGKVTLKIFDMKGRLVKTIYDQQAAPLPKQAVWDGKKNSGKAALAGPYIAFCECLFNGKSIVRKIPIALSPK